MVDAPEDFASAIAELRQDPERTRRLVEQAGAWVEALDWRAITARYVDLVETV